MTVVSKLVENKLEQIKDELSTSPQLFTTEKDDLYSRIEPLYKDAKDKRLCEILTALHLKLISLFKRMNTRLPTKESEGYFWADESRQLINLIEIIDNLYTSLKGTECAFDIDSYHLSLINKLREILSPSFGSTLPAHMEKIEIYTTIPIFTFVDGVKTDQFTQYPLKQIGEGSYAIVYKYNDKHYQKTFALKRAKKGLTTNELERFRQEFLEMKKLSSPNVLEVYSYHEDKNEYIMEFVDYSLSKFIEKKNSTLSIKQRQRIVIQILRVFHYIHSKPLLHRDISPHNILIHEYEDNSIIIKIADFGLVKVPDSTLTDSNTTIKGSFNDPSLQADGFNHYNVLHEIYALTRIVYYVLTGRTVISNIPDERMKDFVDRGTNIDKSKRFQDVLEMQKELKELFDTP